MLYPLSYEGSPEIVAVLVTRRVPRRTPERRVRLIH